MKKLLFITFIIALVGLYYKLTTTKKESIVEVKQTVKQNKELIRLENQKDNTKEIKKDNLNEEREFYEFVTNELKFNQQQIYENELVFCDLSLENEFEESHLKSICLNYDLNQESCLTYKKNCPANGYSAKEEELLYFLHPMEILSYLKKRDEQEAYQINPLDPPRRDTAYWDKKLEELKILKQRMDY